jgi:hypothetical protein
MNGCLRVRPTVVKMLRRQISLALSQQTRSVKTKAGSLSAAHPFTFSEGTFETHNCPHPSMDTTATKEELLSLYKVMVEIRRLEMACDQVITEVYWKAC